MQALTFALTFPILWLISKLPFWLLYRLSDAVFVLVYSVFRVRRSIVARQLADSFPDRSLDERKALARSYYRNLCDLVVEVIKSLSMSAEEMRRRCPVENLEILDQFGEQERSVVAVLGHYGNWEWAALTSALHVTQPMVVVYKPLSNPYFDRWFARNRSRFGVELVPMKQVGRYYIENRKRTFVACFVSDQAPRRVDQAYWTQFLNQETAVHWGAEKLARKFGHAVIFASTERVRRGRYRLTLETLCEDPAETREGEVSELHVRKLEEKILASPESWLWSHRRWKRQRPSQPAEVSTE